MKNDPSEWMIFENTHEAIIEKPVFEVVQKIRDGRRRLTLMGEMPILSGMMFCADCENKLYQVRGRGWEHEKEYFVCATYRKIKGGCSSHQIRNVVVEELLFDCPHVKTVGADKPEVKPRVIQEFCSLQDIGNAFSQLDSASHEDAERIVPRSVEFGHTGARVSPPNHTAFRALDSRLGQCVRDVFRSTKNQVSQLPFAAFAGDQFAG